MTDKGAIAEGEEPDFFERESERRYVLNISHAPYREREVLPMSDETTIEEKMREVERDYKGSYPHRAIHVADAIRIAREHAEARARPLREALEQAGQWWGYEGDDGVRTLRAIKRALAAEARHRGDAEQSAEGGR